MARQEHFEKGKSADLGNPGDVPPEFGTTPIPEGMVRFSHYTNSVESLPKIMSEGLLQRHAQESFARGGTESPQIFASAGTPSADFKRSHAFVEGWANPARGIQLDAGENYGDWDPKEHAEGLMKRKSTLTFRGDVPANQLLASHEPWHETYRYIMGSKQAQESTLAGDYDDMLKDPFERKAIQAAKVASMARRGGGM